MVYQDHAHNPIFGGSTEYCAPEQLEKPAEVGTYAIDIWAFGCVILEFLSKRTRDIKLLLSQNSRFLDDIWISERLLHIGYSDKLKDILYSCLRINPQDRPTAEVLLLRLAAHQLEVGCVTLQACFRGYLEREKRRKNVTERDDQK